MIDQKMTLIREIREKKDYRFPFTLKIENIINTYQYNHWKIYKEELIEILLDGLQWCEKEFLNQSLNPNWCDLLEKYHHLLFKIEANGLSAKERKARLEPFLIKKAKLKEQQFEILRKHGISNGQAYAFYLPPILKVYKELQKTYGGYEEKIHDLREDILRCQKKIRTEGKIITQKFDLTPQIEQFLFQFKGSLNNQLELLSTMKLPSFESIWETMKKGNDLKFYLTTSIFEDNLYGDRRTKSVLSDEEKLIDFHSKERLRDNYEQIEFGLKELILKWKESNNFKIVILEFLKNSWFYDVRHPYLDKIITYFIDSDFVGYYHIIIPQIEGILRDLLHINNISIYKEKRNNVSIQEYLLSGEIIPEIRKHDLMDQDLLILIELYLFDPNYKNLRHNTLHGFHDIRVFDELKADILLWILLRLSKIQPKKKKK